MAQNEEPLYVNPELRYTNESHIAISPHLAKILKPHQIEGIRFMWSNLTFNPTSSEGFGCLLAHSMGLGKTLQVLTLLDVLFRNKLVQRVVALVPVNTLGVWNCELDHWLPPDNNDSYQRSFRAFFLHDSANVDATLDTWHSQGGLAFIGYEKFVSLVMMAGGPTEVKKRRKLLLNPGPDMIVCDEGHRLKSRRSQLGALISSLRTHRRLVLTGYPLQNNLTEYFHMIDFVRPTFLGDQREFEILFREPIMQGLCSDVSEYNRRRMRFRAHILHELMRGLVHRRGPDILVKVLPPKREAVIFVRMNDYQVVMYNTMLGYNTNLFKIDFDFDRASSETTNTRGVTQFFRFYSQACRIAAHPHLIFESFRKSKKEFSSSQKNPHVDASSATKCEPIDVNDVDFDLDDYDLPCAWAESFVEPQSTSLPCDVEFVEFSSKMLLAINLIDACVVAKEKVVLFSQSLLSLSLIESFLSKRRRPTTSDCWTKNVDYFRLDGATHTSIRGDLLAKFNAVSEDEESRVPRLFLVSTRAGSLGMSLVGASRLILFDVSWNPCQDRQAVGRIFRYGQTRPVFVYRLVADKTLERNIYDRQLAKRSIFKRVIDDASNHSSLSSTTLSSLQLANPYQTCVYNDVDTPTDFSTDDAVLASAISASSAALKANVFADVTAQGRILSRDIDYPEDESDMQQFKLSMEDSKLARDSYENAKRDFLWQASGHTSAASILSPYRRQASDPTASRLKNGRKLSPPKRKKTARERKDSDSGTLIVPDKTAKVEPSVSSTAVCPPVSRTLPAFSSAFMAASRRFKQDRLDAVSKANDVIEISDSD